MNKNDIIVSICCITYNHAKYIKQALDGFLMQKTDFKFEVLIHDDASTDGTAEIIREYEKKYPDIIKPIYQKENQYSKGILVSKTFNFPRVTGKYVALCEGDDYWTDEYKLQKQVNFLENNPDYTICSHHIIWHYEDGSREDFIHPTPAMKRKPICFEQLLKKNLIHTCSMMYRWEAVPNFAEKFPSNIMPGDWYMHLSFAKVGKIMVLDDVMSVYRINAGGIWHSAHTNDNETFYAKHALRLANFFEAVYINIADKSEEYYIKVLMVYKNILIHLFESKHNKALILKIVKEHPKIVFDTIVFYCKVLAKML